MDYFAMELTDRMISNLSTRERELITEMDLRGVTDVGNITSWQRRLDFLSDDFSGDLDAAARQKQKEIDNAYNRQQRYKRQQQRKFDQRKPHGF